MEVFLLIDFQMEYNANSPLWLSLPLSLKEKIFPFQEVQSLEPIFMTLQKTVIQASCLILGTVLYVAEQERLDQRVYNLNYGITASFKYL